MRPSDTLRRFALLCLVVFSAAVPPSVRALAAPQSHTIFAPERFTRGTSAPATVVRTFTVAPPVAGPFTLTIDSGEPDPRRPGALTNVARGTVRVNGVEVVGPRDFANQIHIERTIALQANNVLEVTLIGAPGSHLTLGITGLVHVVVSAITPDNGPVGTEVLITGSGFDPIASNNHVSFNGAGAQVVSAATTAIQAIVPPDAATGPITVTTPNGSASSPPFTVTAANQLLISKSPDQASYRRGQPITITAILVDGNGQPIPNAVVALASTPAEDSRTGDTFVYHSDGTYTITATAEAAGQPSSTASITLTVQGAGTTIACAPGFDNRMITGTPGPLAFGGSVSSVNGISQFTVNGADVAVAADGTFTTSITAGWGVNTVILALVDNAGLQTQQVCSFLLSNIWVEEDQFNANSVMLRNAQAAIDDISRAGGINSVGDVLFGVLNSVTLRDTLDNALAAANPLKPMSCDQSVFGVCVVNSEVLYVSSQLTGPNTNSLTLVNGGMTSRVRFEDPRVRLRVRRTAGLSYDVIGDVILDFVEVDTTFDTGIDGAGRPTISVRAGSVATRVGVISVNFTGVDAFVLENIVVPIAQGQLRDLVRNVLRDFVVSHFAAVLDGVVSNLDVITLPASFEVPRLNAGALTMNFGLSFSSLNTTSARALFGIGTRFVSATAHARPSLGTAVQSPPFIDPPSGGRPMTEAFHESLRGQALHALWRAGYFDTILTSGALNGAVPAGAALVTVANLPPVTRIRSDARTEIALGGMHISLEHPALFANTLDGSLAGRVSCGSQLAGDAIVLEACAVDELHFVADRPLAAAATAEVEALLANVLGAMLARAADTALPVLPVPAFMLPASFGTYGLPTTGSLGLVTPTFSTQTPHYLLRGAMGIR